MVFLFDFRRISLVPCPALPLYEAHFLPRYLFPFLLSLSSPDPCKDIPGAPLLTHQNSIKFILQNIFCNQEVISNWLSMQARAATVEYQEDPSIIGRPACSWPDPTSSFTLESRFRPDKRFRAAAPCGDLSQDTIYYPPLPSSPLLGIRSNFIGPFGDAGKQSQTNAVGFARSFTTFKHNIFLEDQIRQRNIRILKLLACVSCVWIPGSVTVNVSIIISSDHRCLYRILVGIIGTPGLENL